MTDKPRINLSPERMFCARHGEPFRARWPSREYLHAPRREACLPDMSRERAIGQNEAVATETEVIHETNANAPWKEKEQIRKTRKKRGFYVVGEVPTLPPRWR